MKKNHGFSLLELLVVISIIGILISIGAVAYTTAQKTGRDARRRADIKAMQDAFEQYRAENIGYETCSTMANYDGGSGAMMPGGLPTDPKNTGVFIYNTSAGCSTTEYCVCAMLESGNGNAAAPTTTTCNYLADGDYYCLRNLQ